jgi:hypothetical protein
MALQPLYFLDTKRSAPNPRQRARDLQRSYVRRVGWRSGVPFKYYSSTLADGRCHHAMAALVVNARGGLEVADNAALLKTYMTQAQIDELGQRLAEADVSFGIVKSSSGGDS